MNLKQICFIVEKNLLIFEFFLSTVFISMYGFNQALWLNLVTLCTLFNTNPWFSASFKVLICITHSWLSFKLHISFLSFPIFIISSKNLVGGSPPPPFCRGWGGVEPPTKFSKRGGRLRWPQLLEGGDFFRGEACSCYIKNKSKSEIFNDKKTLVSNNIFLCHN